MLPLGNRRLTAVTPGSSSPPLPSIRRAFSGQPFHGLRQPAAPSPPSAASISSSAWIRSITSRGARRPRPVRRNECGTPTACLHKSCIFPDRSRKGSSRPEAAPTGCVRKHATPSRPPMPPPALHAASPRSGGTGSNPPHRYRNAGHGKRGRRLHPEGAAPPSASRRAGAIPPAFPWRHLPRAMTETVNRSGRPLSPGSSMHTRNG